MTSQIPANYQFPEACLILGVVRVRHILYPQGSQFLFGATDDFSYNIVKDPIHIRDLHATILHLFGIEHDRLTFQFQGLNQKLTGVLPAKIIDGILA